MKLAYCPVCKNALDEQDRCWAVCPLAGLAQPPIHRAEFVEDEHVMTNACGEIVRIYSTLRRVGIPRGESETVYR